MQVFNSVLCLVSDRMRSKISIQMIILAVKLSWNGWIFFCLDCRFNLAAFTFGTDLCLNFSMLKCLQIRGGSAGVIESFYGVIKPITIV